MHIIGLHLCISIFNTNQVETLFSTTKMCSLRKLQICLVASIKVTNPQELNSDCNEQNFVGWDSHQIEFKITKVVI